MLSIRSFSVVWLGTGGGTSLRESRGGEAMKEILSEIRVGDRAEILATVMQEPGRCSAARLIGDRECVNGLVCSPLAEGASAHGDAAVSGAGDA
jgi:hypothetical protein